MRDFGSDVMQWVYRRLYGAATGSAPLRIDISYPNEDTVVVAPAGEADMFNVPDLQRALIGAIGTGRPRLIVDLDQLTFMDASTLNLLVATRLLMITSGDGTVQVRCHNRRHRRLLFITGLDGMLEMR